MGFNLVFKGLSLRQSGHLVTASVLRQMTFIKNEFV